MATWYEASDDAAVTFEKYRVKYGLEEMLPENRRSAHLIICVRPGEKRQLEREAQQAGLPLSTYIYRVFPARLTNMAGSSEPRKSSDDRAVSPKEQRSARLLVLLTPVEKGQLEREAQQAGKYLSTYVYCVVSARANNKAELSDPRNASDDRAVTPKEQCSAEVMFRVRPREKRQLEREARRARLPLSTYIRRILSARVNNVARLSELPKASDDGVIAPDDRRSEHLMVMIRPGELIQLNREAQQAGLTLSTYMHRRLFGEGR